MTLREQLANKLFDVVWKARHRELEPDMLYDDAQFTEYADLADECIRQMAWTAFKAAHSYRSGEGFPDEAHALRESADFVTLAPEDWKP